VVGDTNTGPPGWPRRVAGAVLRAGRDLSARDCDLTATDCDPSAFDRDITVTDRDPSAFDHDIAATDRDLSATDWARAICARLINRVTGGRGCVVPAMGPPLPRLGPCGARAPSMRPISLDRGADVVRLLDASYRHAPARGRTMQPGVYVDIRPRRAWRARVAVPGCCAE